MDVCGLVDSSVVGFSLFRRHFGMNSKERKLLSCSQDNLRRYDGVCVTDKNRIITEVRAV
jgi:hypothetical protein